MSPATSAQVRRRHAARREALKRQQILNEERRRRDELEIELAADFALFHEEWDAARAAVVAAELEMGRVVDRMIELRVRYPRAAQLLEVPEDELRRLRQQIADSGQNTGPSRGDDDLAREEEQPRQARQRRPRTSRPRPRATGDVADGAESPAPGTDLSVGQGGPGDAQAGAADTAEVP